MAFLTVFLLLGLTFSIAVAGPASLPLVRSAHLRRDLTPKSLLNRGRLFETFATYSPDGSRFFGSIGHNLTVSHIATLLERTGYYDVELQTFDHLFSEGEAAFNIRGGADFTDETGWFIWSPSGDETARLGVVRGTGCSPGDYPPTIRGKIALIPRGACDFGLKVAYAGSVGAAAALIYNNVAGPLLGGTLGAAARPEGPYVPVGSISRKTGLALVAAAAKGVVVGRLVADGVTEVRTSTNVLATTRGGDHSNVVFLGAHTDSVRAGPGINDNASGTVGLLELALQLARFSVLNAVRFGFWTAEEVGLVGSEYYVATLAPEELGDIALYINADMIASPNFGYFVYDGSGGAFNISGPPGSGHIERVFRSYFRNEAGLPTAPTEFTGRSDYGPFLDVGVPCGGLFTGAEGIKTTEEAELFGGTAGVAYDVNYHAKGDTLANCNVEAWIQNTRALAHAVAVFARSLEGIPRAAGMQRTGVKVKGNGKEVLVV